MKEGKITMPTIFSGVENRLTSTVNALNEANEALDAKANAVLTLSMLAATVSLIALKRR